MSFKVHTRQQPQPLVALPLLRDLEKLVVGTLYLVADRSRSVTVGIGSDLHFSTQRIIFVLGRSPGAPGPSRTFCVRVK